MFKVNLSFVLYNSLLIKKLLILLTLTFTLSFIGNTIKKINTGAPPYDTADEAIHEPGVISWLNNWRRPDVPAKVALQVGHYKNNELPDELSRLRGNTGASGGGITEIEVNLKIAEETKKILSEHSIDVEILPATVPPRYWADVFVAIHADGNINKSVSGFKAASPRRDFTKNGGELVKFIESEYESATGMVKDQNISRNMTGYYAFAWHRYEHAVNPMTASAILETGFLSSPKDRKIIVDKPELSAKGLARGIIKYLRWQKLIS